MRVIHYCVMTPSSLIVFEGNLRDCNRYIRQALAKGSERGFLSLVRMDVVRTVEVK